MTKIVGPSGVVIDINHDMATCLVDAGHARFVKNAAPVVAADAPTVPVQVGEPGQPAEAPQPLTPAVPPPPEEPPTAPVVAADAPRGNASREEFAAYATNLGIAFDEDATRDEIRALVSKE
ncbi:hypothetical protein [Leucobacter aridicollis]|uniref:hypothetical protein n=1 Tax=Leucobacter aridicollis TaxID=283878 RepID=UPI0021696F78|nr:hypothetical protein [Leucobacter aridicollis]MCS3426750.1 hypothetical protein [Leucobacter aridicollis]